MASIVDFIRRQTALSHPESVLRSDILSRNNQVDLTLAGFQRQAGAGFISVRICWLKRINGSRSWVSARI